MKRSDRKVRKQNRSTDLRLACFILNNYGRGRGYGSQDFKEDPEEKSARERLRKALTRYSPLLEWVGIEFDGLGKVA